MLLPDKNAIVYGAAGPVGAAVAAAFAREGARVVLAGRTQPTLARVADQIRDAGGAARVAVVDVTDMAAMRVHAAEVAAASEGIDILAMAGGREAIPRLGGSHVAWSALAGLSRQLAAELGPHGIRVAWLLSPGSPDPGAAPSGDDDPLAGGALIGRRPSYQEVANAAVFAASDWAATMTAAEINLTGGAVID